MAGGIRIVTASYPGLPLEMLVEKGIGVLPVWVTGVENPASVNYKPIYGLKEEQGYGEELTKINNNLFELLLQRKKAKIEMPGTSQPDEDSIRDYFKNLFQKTGCEGAIVISIIQKDSKTDENLSGTYAVVAKVAGELGVKAICGETASVGLGLLAMYGVDLLNQGKSGDYVAGQVQGKISRVTVLAALGDLYYASHGGRVKSFVNKAMGTASKFKLDKFIVPILKLHRGHMGLGGIAFSGADGINKKLLQMVPKRIEQAAVVFSAPATYEPAQNLAAMIAQKTKKYIPIGPIGPELGVHAGPKTWGLAYIE